MASQYTHDVVFGSRYNDRNGQEKTSWKKCGVAFTNDKGQISLKIDMLPVCSDPKGLWLSLFTPNANGDAPRGRQQPQDSQDSGAPIDGDGSVPF